MYSALRLARNVFAIVNVSDELFYHTSEKRIEQLRITLERMYDAVPTLNPGKVQLATSRLKLIRSVVDEGTVQSSRIS